MGNELDNRRIRPEDDPTPGLWTIRSAVLTPGDRVEYKLTMKKGDVLFASAESDAFDPALSVVDAKGKELIKNDDREEGDQSPFLEVKAPADGVYLLKVLSFRSAAGGKFEIRIRTFTPLEAKFDKQIHPAPSTTLGERGRTVVRFTGVKGKIYDLRRVFGTRPNPPFDTSSSMEYVRTIGPSGVDENDFLMLRSPDDTPVVEALKDGDFYAEYEGDRTVQIRTDFREVAVLPIKASDRLTLDFAPGEIKVVELPVDQNQIVRTVLKGRAIAQRLVVPSDPLGTSTVGGDPTYGIRQGWTWFRPVRDSDDDVVRVFHKKETARFLLRSTDGITGETATLTNTDSLPEWKSGVPIEGQMAIGESRLYTLKSGKSELMKASIMATQFLVRLDIFQLNGQRANTLLDSRTNRPIAELYYPEPEQFVVRVTCDGYGGSGPYTMTRETAVATAYALGTTQAIDLDGRNFKLYSVDLEAGKRYQMVYDHPDHPLRLDVLDEEGRFIGSQGVDFDTVAVRYFVPTRTGRHRLWFRGEPGSWHIKLEPHVPPVVG